MKLVEQAYQAPPHPGPSLAYRIAHRLNTLGLSTWLGHLPDPWATTLAKPRRWVWRRFRV
ncbi:MAG: hypothetical protein KDJ65_21100 [Anaerolineae bacterium]|nr:hypothetical protein [Anaerolineae bacterium]